MDQVTNPNNLTNRFKPRNLILLFVLFFLLIVIVVVQLIRTTTIGKQTSPKTESTNLQITSITPPPSDSIDLATNFEITFNKPIKPDQVYIETSPFTPINILPGSNSMRVILTPQGVWTDGEKYKIKILKTTAATDKSTLKADYLIDFTAHNTKPEIINDGGGDH